MTGATGPFGKAILHYLNENIPGCSVVILTRSPEKAKSEFGHCRYLDIDYIELDFANVKGKEYLEIPGCEYVIHMASVTAAESYNSIDPFLKYRVLESGAELIASYCIHNKVKKALFTSSGAVYGEYSAMEEINESDSCKVMVDMPDKYALSIGKLAAEFTFSYLNKYTSTDSCICRCFGICGPGLPVDLHYALGNFVDSALKGKEIIIRSDGSSRRSFMDTRDLSRWILSLLTSETKYLIYNVGSNEAISIKDLAETVRKVTGSISQIEIRGEDCSRLSNPNVSSFVPSINRAMSEGLGLEYKLVESIRYYADWVMSSYRLKNK